MLVVVRPCGDRGDAGRWSANMPDYVTEIRNPDSEHVIGQLRESGFRYAEIADVIDVRAEIVPTLIARALKRFQKAYRQETTDVAS